MAAAGAWARSFLFVPADSERKLARASGAGADALILDLEDSVATDRKLVARDNVRDFIHGLDLAASARCWVRINDIGGLGRADLSALSELSFAGVVLPKAEGPQDVARCRDGVTSVNDRDPPLVLALAFESPAAVLRASAWGEPVPGLAGVAWGAEDLRSVLGAAGRGEDGRFSGACSLARALCLCAAAASGVPAIEAVFPNLRDLAGLERAAQSARRDGFSGMFAIHPDQVAVINAAFDPSDEIATAEALLRAHADAGVSRRGDEMADAPHLQRARRLVEMAARGAFSRSG